MLIPDNKTLTLFIPNVMEAIPKGSPTLYDRIKAYVDAAEIWFAESVADPELIEAADDPKALFLARRVVALHAWCDALPSVDILVTNSGLAVPESQSVKPASKARVERLLKAISGAIDSSLSLLLGRLAKIPQWRQSPQGSALTASLFRTLDDLRLLGVESDFLNSFRRLLPTIIDAENHIARLWVSFPVMRRLRNVDRSDPTAPELPLIAEVMQAVAEFIEARKTNRVSTLHAQAAADIVTGHPDLYPEFIGSDTHTLFSVPPFENKKDAPAHWL